VDSLVTAAELAIRAPPGFCEQPQQLALQMGEFSVADLVLGQDVLAWYVSHRWLGTHDRKHPHKLPHFGQASPWYCANQQPSGIQNAHINCR
jgi:hypothetical protein